MHNNIEYLCKHKIIRSFEHRDLFKKRETCELAEQINILKGRKNYNNGVALKCNISIFPHYCHKPETALLQQIETHS